jgi:hypothetical protein
MRRICGKEQGQGNYILEWEGGDEMVLVSAGVLKYPVGQMSGKRGEKRYVLGKYTGDIG